jgi:tetratricopeptide (TPR) repeat protein
MEVRAVHQGLRRGLVVIFVLVSVVASTQDRGPAGGGRTDGNGGGAEAAAGGRQLILRGWDEVSRAERPRAYTNPAWLLLLVPGTLWFGYALLGRLFPRRLAFFVLLPLLLGAAPGGPERMIREAERLYGAGQYASALQLYRQAATLLPANPVLLYDLAVAADRVGERGYAIAYLRRALKQDPGDRVTRGALRYLEDSYELQGQVPPPLPVHPDLPFFLTIGSANLTLIVAGLVVRRGRVQFLIALVLAAVFTAAALGVFLARLQAEARPVGVLIGQTRLLRIPEADSRNWLELPAGTTLRVRGRAAGYSLVETGSQLKGWVAEERIILD